MTTRAAAAAGRRLGHRRHAQALAGTKGRARVQLGQELRAHVELLAEGFGQGRVTQVRELRLLLVALGDLDEGSRRVLRRDRVGGQRRASGIELAPGCRVHHAGHAELVPLLEGEDRLAGVATVARVDLAGREARAIEQDLRAKDGGTPHAGAHHLRRTGAVGGGPVHPGRGTRRGRDGGRNNRRGQWSGRDGAGRGGSGLGARRAGRDPGREKEDEQETACQVRCGRAWVQVSGGGFPRHQEPDCSI
jgi:hypothetical protein